MNISGPMQESERQEQERKKEEEKRVSCVVKFRPCKDWRGEYGFDWVRKGEEDYEERIDLMDTPYTKDQKKQIIRKHMGEEKYRKWQRKHALAILNANSEEETKKARQDYQRSFDDYYNKLTNTEVMESFDSDAWKTKKDDTFSEAKSQKDQGATPMEYAYPAKYVTRVVYVMDRKQYGNVWFTSRLEYEDMANGSKEIQDKNDPAAHLDYLVNVDGHIQSLYSNNNIIFYSIPNYLDGLSSEQVPSSFDRQRLSDQWWFLQNGDYHYKKIKKVVFDEFLYGDVDSIQADELRISTKVIRFVKFADTDRAMAYKFKYIKLKGKMHVTAFVDCVYEGLARRCCCHYIDGKLSKVFCGEKWRLLENAKNDNKYKEEALLLERMSNELFLDRMIQNKNIDINYLCKQDKTGGYVNIKDGVLDHIQMTLSDPSVLDRCFLTEVDGYRKEDGKEFWGDYEITSWETRYLDSFRSLDLILKNEDETEKKVDYSIPVLSFGVSEFPRKRFTFRTLHDAPSQELEKNGEFKLQLRLEGNCPKLRFDTNNPNVSVNPKEISDPKDHDEITIKFTGKSPCWPSVFAICVDDNENEKRVGQLSLHIEEKRNITIGLVNVIIDNKPLSSKFSSAIEDNVDLMNNALLQAGIEPKYIRSSINIKSSQIRHIMSGKDIDYDKSDALDKLLKKELNTQRENNVELRFSYLIFCVDRGLTDSIVGYSSSEYNLIVISNSSAFDRADISTLTHELLHALRHPHHFQLNLNNNESSNAFCFPIKTSSNIMDYYTLNYSLHQYQWWLMQNALDGHNEEVKLKMEAERIRLKEKNDKEKKKKRQKRDNRGRIII